MSPKTAGSDGVGRLDVFIGKWRVGLGSSIPSGDGGARSVFEWTLDGRFLIQRTEIPDPAAPNALAIVAFDAQTNGVWSLLREKPDFSPLDFKQRFTARVSGDRDAIFGTWEIDRGSGWTKDFDLTYGRVIE